MAIGTVASRATGFLRTTILIYALGTAHLSDAYNLANTLPNAIYNLALGGILTSVVVPLLVRAAQREDRGDAYNQRIFTLGILALGAVTIVATLFAGPIALLYGHSSAPGLEHLTEVFSYFFFPQVFFYGVSSLVGAMLNSRGSFGAPMWTPVINNIVVIVVGGAFIATAGLDQTPTSITSGEITLLGLGTTAGIVLQTVALVPALRRVGFSWRPRFDFRRAEVSEIGRMGGWMVVYVLSTQVYFLANARVAGDVGGPVATAGYAAYSNAWQLFQLPYAIIGISVITAMLPRMSRHAADGDYRRVSSDFSWTTRVASVMVAPAGLVLAVLGTPLAEAIFSYGSSTFGGADTLGKIFAAFSLGLLPYMLFQLQLRVFYSMHDSRTPALIGLFTMVLNVATCYISLWTLPARDVVIGIGAGYGIVNVIGTAVAWVILTRRLGGLDGRRVTRSLVRMHAATIPALLAAVATVVMVGVLPLSGRLEAFADLILGGALALLLYVMFARAFKIAELTELTESVTRRFRR